MNCRNVRKCFDYTLEVLLGGHIQDKKETSKIVYGSPGCKRSQECALYIVPCGFFGEHYGKPESLPSLPLKEVEGVPLLYGSPKINREGRSLVVYADIIASTYFMVTRYEEVIRRAVRDEHGRFPGRESLPYRAGFINRPIVEEYASLLRKWLRETGVNVPEPEREFSVLLTHDVDATHKYNNPLQTAASAMLGRRSWRDVRENLAICLRSMKDPFNTFDRILELDSSITASTIGLRAESVFFFMAGGQSKFDGMCRIQSRLARSILHKVRSSGATIGLHASYDAGLHPELVVKEKTALERICGVPVYSNRFHYLCWREIRDGWVLAEVGINWDATLGYADVAGFRLGICRPISLWDPVKMQEFGIEEHPLIVMDCTLSNTNYMNLEEEEAFSYCQNLVDHTRKHNGEFVSLWHNTAFVSEKSNYHPRLYQRLLHELHCDPEKSSQNKVQNRVSR